MKLGVSRQKRRAAQRTKDKEQRAAAARAARMQQKLRSPHVIAEGSEIGFSLLAGALAVASATVGPVVRLVLEVERLVQHLRKSRARR